jgi:hypothetical protein
MASTEDFTVFFDDFAIEAMVGVAPVMVIFDSDYISASDQFGGVGGSLPRALMKSSDVATHNITRNTALIINGTEYYVIEPRPDGTGLTLLVLSTEPA